MKDIHIKLLVKERMQRCYNNMLYILNPKYKKSLSEVSKKFRKITDSQSEELYKYLYEYFFCSSEDGYLESDIGKNDVKDHMINRLLNFRNTIIPWLNTLIKFEKSNILEIGCGTGSTAVALAEQGCKLTSIDVNNVHIKVAEKRCKLYNLTTNIFSLNAIDIKNIREEFNMIIFSASLEHMTYDERIISLKLAWEMLKKDGFLVVIETPNRLFYYDGHSSLLPFYHWLPDQIAMQYSKFSPRERCKNNSFDYMNFIRFGRGASFHEFEIALDIKCCDLTVCCMQQFQKSFISGILTNEHKYNIFMRKLGPKNIPDGFYYNNLYIAIKKA
jgi:S-adenosylmethionine-dependent methyltransferase